jgi:hypothetical protein
MIYVAVAAVIMLAIEAVIIIPDKLPFIRKRVKRND